MQVKEDSFDVRTRRDAPSLDRERLKKLVEAIDSLPPAKDAAKKPVKKKSK
jgi:hypothetical protein